MRFAGCLCQTRPCLAASTGNSEQNFGILVEMKTQIKSVWQVHEAKTHLSEVLQKATDLGPQVITKHGVECGAVISIADSKKLRSTTQKKLDFVEYLSSGPKIGNDLADEIFARDPDVGREIDFTGPEFDHFDEK